MAYKLENFLIPISETDRLLRIKEGNGIIKHTIDGYSVTSLRAVNNIVKIITKSNTIDLDFSTTNEARIALSRIQSQLDTLKEKTPLFVEKKFSNYVTEYTGTQGFADKYSATSSTPLQVPAIGEIISLFIQQDLGYTTGQSVLAYNTLIDNYFNEDYIEESSISFQGRVDGYDKSTGLLSLLIDNSAGYGLTNSQNQIATYSFWNLNLIGQLGPQGLIGGTGSQGLADRYSATSSTPLQIPEAGYVANLVTQTNLAYTPGQSVLVYNTLTENYMVDDYVEEDSSILFIGQIDNYIPSTGDLQLVVNSSVGYGLTDSNNEIATYSFWYINITGQTGQDGQGGTGGTGNYVISATAPSGPNSGDRWYDLTTGLEYVYINDGDSSQWIAPSQAGAQGLTGPQGPLGGGTGNQGETGPQGFQGETGSQGPLGGGTGNQGDTGPQGYTGPQGVTGGQGVTGIQGPTGSGNVPIDLYEVAFGTNTGITSSNNFTWNDPTANFIASTQSAIINGSLRSAIIGGLSHSISNSEKSIIIGGYFNTIKDTSSSAIIAGGFSNVICDGECSAIIGGFSNYIGGFPTESQGAVIIGGLSNKINESGYNTSIISGKNNCACCSSQYSSIIAGYDSLLYCSCKSVIIGGEANTICDSKNSAIIGGFSLTLSNESCVAYVPTLKIATASNVSADRILVWDTDNYVKYRDVSTISEGGGVTGPQGNTGSQGSNGLTGPQGPTGPSISPIVGSWSLSTGANTVSFTVTGGESYIMWLNGNIPNGIVNWNATVTLSNSNVPVVGVQYGWYYLAGNALVLTSIPNQIVGDAGTISTSAPGFTNSNTFEFGITNNSVSSQIIYYGYTKIS
jgi:hypothetical protein